MIISPYRFFNVKERGIKNLLYEGVRDNQLIDNGVTKEKRYKKVKP